MNCAKPANGVRYLRLGGRGQCLGAEKTQSQKNTRREASHTADVWGFPLMVVFALDFQDSCCTLC